jgi:hypothetical protein
MKGKASPELNSSEGAKLVKSFDSRSLILKGNALI